MCTTITVYIYTHEDIYIYIIHTHTANICILYYTVLYTKMYNCKLHYAIPLYTLYDNYTL